MDHVYRLRNTIQEYAWGSPTAIPDLLGLENPERKPMAELWMGAHPQAPSRIVECGREHPLPERIAEDPPAVLGEDVARRFDGRLPFLFKVLAAATPLSIQAHPSREIAARGFAREERDGIPRDAPHRNYKDANHKPEILCAQTEFWALNGFRPLGEIAGLLGELAGPELAPLLAPLQGSGSSGLRELFEAIMTLPRERQARAVREVAESAGRATGERAELRWIRRLDEQYPGDVGVLAAAMLHLIRLRPGEALFLPAQQLHAYLEGVGVELMASCDNVLRGGLTVKHVDVPELLAVIDFAPSPLEILRPEARAAGEWVYRTPAPEFELSVLDPGGAGAGRVSPERRGVEILLCIEGTARLRFAGSEPLPLARGESLLVAAAAQDYVLQGEARVYRASVPPATSPA